MPQSLVQIYAHIIFSTKNRSPLILPENEKEIYQFLSNQCDLSGCIALEVGGWLDHVHILCRLSKHITLPVLLERVKGKSSRWIKTKFELQSEFYWQDGYEAFSISPKEINSVASYIQNQQHHHMDKSFKKEYLDILNQYEVEYDERYLWD